MSEESPITPQRLGGVVSKLLSAGIGDIALVFSKSPDHKHHAFADLEWMILPAVISGQYYVAELAHKEHGARAPVAALLWASVSDETDARLRADPSRRIRLRPDEWLGGPHVWIVDMAGEPTAALAALRHLSETTFKEKDVRMAARGADGSAHVMSLRDVLARPNGTGTAA